MKPILLACAILAATAGLASARTVLADGFETETAGGNAALSKWAVVSGSVDVVGTGFYPFYGPGRYLDLNGSTGTAGRIERVLTGLVAGKTYTLGFDYGVNPWGATRTERLSFGLGGFEDAIDIRRPAEQLIAVSYSFVASASSAVLFFADGGTTPGDNGGPVIDNIVVATVPLPASAPLVLAALGGLGLLRLRRKAA